jgi:hypothetical protein
LNDIIDNLTCILPVNTTLKAQFFDHLVPVGSLSQPADDELFKFWGDFWRWHNLSRLEIRFCTQATKLKLYHFFACQLVVNPLYDGFQGFGLVDIIQVVGADGQDGAQVEGLEPVIVK